MNLFFKRLTGQLHSAERVEKHILEEEERIARYRRVENSENMKEFLALKKVVESDEFQRKKEELIRTKYKHTPICSTLREYKRLLENKQLQRYLAVKDSRELREYLIFRQSADYVKLSNRHDVKHSMELQQMARFEKSKAYKAYLTYGNSELPKRFLKLAAEVNSEQFQKEHAFWSNPKRWNTTLEYQQEVKYKSLSVLPDIIFFLKQDVANIEAMEKWHITFSDDCDWDRLSDSQWKAGFAYDNPKLLHYHSFANEQQANNGGKNVGTVERKLCLFTKKERTLAPAWHTKKGFINKEFEYTSDVIQTADVFRQSQGLFMIKLRVEGDIHHAAWLGSGAKLPMISLFHFNGKHITVGNYSANEFDGEVIRGINPKNYYIYSLRWTEKELIWYVNNLEVYRTSNNVPKEKLYFALSSFIDEHQRGSEGQLNVTWVRAFGLRS